MSTFQTAAFYTVIALLMLSLWLWGRALHRIERQKTIIARTFGKWEKFSVWATETNELRCRHLQCHPYVFPFGRVELSQVAIAITDHNRRYHEDRGGFSEGR